jgi:hypothetical protein
MSESARPPYTKKMVAFAEHVIITLRKDTSSVRVVRGGCATEQGTERTKSR